LQSNKKILGLPTSVVPAQLENSKGEKAKKGPVQPTTNLKHIEDDTGIDGKKETPHGRDRLTLRIFGDTPAELEMYCVATILNSIRQFHACESFNDDFSLNGELLGTKAPSSCAEEVDIIGSEVSGPDSESSLCQQLREDLVWSRITIPALNESQQRACDGFVSDGGARIHIVQGCVHSVRTVLSYDCNIPSSPLLSVFAVLLEQVGSTILLKLCVCIVSRETFHLSATPFRSIR